MSADTYEESLAELRRALAFGINPSLSGIEALCEALGRPQDGFRVVQVAGTNGKTSTARVIEAALVSQGVSAALYTSPELERYPERMQVGGVVVSDHEFARAIREALDAAQHVRPDAQGTPAGFTEFELLTAAALWHFREVGVRVAVLEAGLGGRWDATSVARADVAVITGVALDHTAILGETRTHIAAEKAAIIREGSTAVLGPGVGGVEQVFEQRARETGSRVLRVGWGQAATVFFATRPSGSWGAVTALDVTTERASYALTAHAPSYQAINIATAVTAAEALLDSPLDARPLAAAIDAVVFPGRFELVTSQPPVIVDGSHNPEAAGFLAGAIAQAWPDTDMRPTVLLGVLADKDAEGIVRALAPVASRFVVAAPDSPRALPAATLADVVQVVTGERAQDFATLPEALEALMGAVPEGLVITGSLTTAGQARALLRARSASEGASGGSV